MPSTKYFLVKYKYKYFYISIHQVLKYINIDNSICFDKVKVATHFNSFFSDIAGNLVDKLPPIIGKYGYDFVKKFYLDKVSMLVGNFSFTPVSKEHVHKMLLGLNSHKATGLDGMPARFIIDSADIICKPLCHIVNHPHLHLLHTTQCAMCNVFPTVNKINVIFHSLNIIAYLYI